MSLELFVKTINNESHRFDVASSMLVSDFKPLVANATEISPDRQRLIYRGQVLQDENTLDHYNIESGHTIHMVARPIGGTPISSPSAEQDGTTDAGIRSDHTDHSIAGTDPLMALLGPLSGDGGLAELLQGNRRAMEATTQSWNAQSLEHIRQSMLTLHTLRASMPPAAFLPSGFNSELSGQTEREETFPKVFYTGQWIDVKDTVNQWLEATVMQIDSVEKKIFVHYNGWPTHWDEWIEFESPRISPFRTRTIHSGSNSLQCPTPATVVSFAPTTGRDDFRRLLPGLLETHEAIGTMLRQAVVLAEQSLQDEPARFDNTPAAVLSATGNPGIAGGMPWESLVPSESSSAGRSGNEGAATADATRRLAELSCLMVPLMDRYGRVLTDIAPHLNVECPTISEADTNSAVQDTAQQRAAPDLVSDLNSMQPGHDTPPLARASRTRSSSSADRNGSGQQQIAPTPDPDSSLTSSLLSTNLPPSLRRLLQPRPPSPPPERGYRQLINGAVGRGGGVGTNHIVDIHIHAILTPSRTGAPGGAQPTAAGSRVAPTRTGMDAPSNSLAGNNSAASEALTVPPPVPTRTSSTTSVALPPVNTLVQDEESSEDDSEDSEDDDSESDDGRDSDMFSGAVSAVSTLLASFNRDTPGSAATTTSTAESTPRQDDNRSIDTAATPNSLSVAVGTPRNDSPIRQSRRRVENNDLVAAGRYSDLSAKERSTAHDLVEKFRSRERERRNQRSVPRLLNESLRLSPKSSAAAGGERVAKTDSPSSISSDVGKRGLTNISPEKIRPLKTPLEGICVEGNTRPQAQLSESLVSQSLEYRERREMERNVLSVQRSFERNSSLSPSSSPQNSPTGCSRSTFGGDSPEKSRMSSFFVAQQAVPSRVSRGGSPSRRVPVAKGRAESRKSHTSPPPEDLAPRRRPSLINRLKRVVSFSDKTNVDKRDEKGK